MGSSYKWLLSSVSVFLAKKLSELSSRAAGSQVEYREQLSSLLRRRIFAQQLLRKGRSDIAVGTSGCGGAIASAGNCLSRGILPDIASCVKPFPLGSQPTVGRYMAAIAEVDEVFQKRGVRFDADINK